MLLLLDALIQLAKQTHAEAVSINTSLKRQRSMGTNKYFVCMVASWIQCQGICSQQHPAVWVGKQEGGLTNLPPPFP